MIIKPFLYKSFQTESYLSVRKYGKTKDQKVVPIIQIQSENYRRREDASATAKAPESVHLVTNVLLDQQSIYSRQKYMRRLRFCVRLTLSSGRPNYFYEVS